MRLLLGIMLLTITAHAQWVKQKVDTTASLRGLSVVNEKIVWASGTEGTVIRTIDGGKTWTVITVPGAEKLDFRDIEAFDANTAYILSIGNGELSRIYKTIDGGKTWKEQFRNKNEKAFFDAIACWDKRKCIAMSDPVDGHFLILRGPLPGRANQIGIRAPMWSPTIYPDRMPSAKEGEAAFAASGTCLVTEGTTNAFLVSGDADARVFKSTDRGLTWTVVDTPMDRGVPGRGIFSIAMLNSKEGVLVGGNYPRPDQHVNNLVFTADGGATWKIGSGLSGYRSAVTYVDSHTIIAVGTNGSDITRDGGLTWLRIDDANYNSVQAKGIKAIWSVGPKGHVAKLDWKKFLEVDGYHPCPRNMICDGPSVDSVDLSHTEISSTCAPSNTDCSEKQQIDVTTHTADVPRNWYEYTVSGGYIIGFGPVVKWDLSDAKPGAYTITAALKQPSFNSYQVFYKTLTRRVTVK